MGKRHSLLCSVLLIHLVVHAFDLPPSLSDAAAEEAEPVENLPSSSRRLVLVQLLTCNVLLAQEVPSHTLAPVVHSPSVVAHPGGT